MSVPSTKDEWRMNELLECDIHEGPVAYWSQVSTAFKRVGIALLVPVLVAPIVLLAAPSSAIAVLKVFTFFWYGLTVFTFVFLAPEQLRDPRRWYSLWTDPRRLIADGLTRRIEKFRQNWLDIESLLAHEDTTEEMRDRLLVKRGRLMRHGRVLLAKVHTVNQLESERELDDDLDDITFDEAFSA